MKNIFIILLLLFPIITFCQTNFYKGYVIKNNGDTLKGYIDYREWVYSPKKITFKNNNVVDSFTPDDIKGFEIKGFEKYSIYKGKVSTDLNIFPNLPDQLDTSTVIKSIFLRQLTTGKNLTLYFNNDPDKVRFFVAEQNQMPVELKFYEYYLYGKTYKLAHFVYTGQLRLYINKYNNDDPKLIQQLENVAYKKTDLQNIIDQINNYEFGKEGAITNKYSNRLDIRFFVGAGINNTSSHYAYATSTYNSQSGDANVVNYSKNIAIKGPKYEFGIDIFKNPVVQKSIFRVAFTYSTLNSQINLPPYGVNLTGPTLNYHQTLITFTPQYIFNIYNTNKLKIYLDAGLTLNKFFFSKNSNDASSTLLQGEILADHINVWNNFPIQAGLVLFKKFELSYTYSNLQSFAIYPIISINNKITSNFAIRYLFD